MRLPKRRDTCYCFGPGGKRYVIAILCAFGLTIVVGMRAEVVGIIESIKKGDRLPSATDKLFLPSELRNMSWTTNYRDDLMENAVFFAHVLGSPLGGYLTLRFDSTVLVGISVFLTCGINVFLPLVEKFNGWDDKLAYIFCIRFSQGLCECCLIPSVYTLLRFWVPEAERSTLVCLSLIGVSAGPLIGLPSCRVFETIGKSTIVYILFAFAGLVWCIFWWRIVEEKPINDTKLPKREWRYLLDTIPRRVMFAKRKLKIPWMKLICSKPLYAIIVTCAADDWTFQIASVCMQSYYRQLFKADVQSTIDKLSIPFLIRSILVVIGGLLIDFLHWKTSCSLLTLRKIFSTAGFSLKAIFFIALGFAPGEMVATVLLSLGLGFSGLAVAAYGTNVLDLTPNYAGFIMGFAVSVTTFCGILSTVMATLIITSFNYTRTGWQVALGVAAAVQIGAAIVYLLLASTDDQHWSENEAEEPEKGEVLEQPTHWRRA